MSKDMALFEGSKMPAHLSDMFGDETNIETGSQINALSIKGKVFRIQFEGDEVPLMRFNEDTGDNEPMSTVNLIIINQGPFGARDYFAKAYDGTAGVAPDCFSVDGKVPHSASSSPQSKSCATCPHAVKGSKMTPAGHATTACAIKRRLAVVPSHKPDFAALLLKLAATSAYDPDTKNAENGWFGWKQYLEFLSARGVRHTAQLVTKVRFDPNAEYPKLLFKPERFLTDEEAKIIGPRIRSEEVTEVVQPVSGPVGVEPEVIEPEMEPEAEKAAAEPEVEKASKPSKTTKKKKVSKKKAAAAEDDDEELERTPAAGQPSKPAPKENKAINDLLDDWDV